MSEVRTAPVQLPPVRRGSRVYMVGIKGSGMAALAEIYADRGATVTGSDVTERFYTDQILRNAGISYAEGFSAANVPRDADLVVYSAAYDPRVHPELLAARDYRLPMIEYTEALGQLSLDTFSVGISGVHGKTTTTALVAAMVRAAGLSGTVLVGSALADLGGRATLILGDAFFVAETCEYRRHFLHFSPDVVLVTSVEADHLDYFRDARDVASAFVEYGRRLPEGGRLIYCADDRGACGVVATLRAERPDLDFVPYGATAPRSAVGGGRSYRVEITSRESGRLRFAVGGLALELHVPGDHNALNVAGAIAVLHSLPGVLSSAHASADDASVDAAVEAAVAGFSGTRRRSEVVGSRDGVVVIDDYGHHPTAIATTLEGLRAFYPGRRIVLSFMSHTYSRTLALLDDLADSLCGADELILHDIYASAREARPDGVDGRVLADAVTARRGRCHYVPAHLDALALVERLLVPGDLFVTMGAGNNWELGRAWLDHASVDCVGEAH